MPSQTIVVGTTENWSKEVEHSDLPVLVDFWAAWCGPCRMVSPVIDKIAEKYSGKVKVVKVNVDENQGLAAKFGIMSIPAILLFDKGRVVSTQIGSAPSQVFENMLAENVRT